MRRAFTFQSLGAAVAVLAISSSTAFAGLVHHYTLDGATQNGIAVDSGSAAVAGGPGTGTDGQFTNGTGDARVAGIIGGAVQTNDESGDRGHFDMELIGLNGATTASWSMWFNLNTGEINNNSTYNGLFMTRDTTFDDGGGPVGGRNMGIALRNNNVPHRLDTRVNNRGSSNSTDIGLNEWVHAALVWDGVAGTQKAYLNGVLEADQMEAQTIGSIVTGGIWNLSDDPCCGNREIAASLDDVAVYDMALTGANIAAIYRGGLAGSNAAEVGIVPEPGTVALILMGLVSMGAVRSRC